MIILHTLSWLAFLAIIPLTAAIIFIKNRSSVHTWIRVVSHPDRWLLSTVLPKESTSDDILAKLKDVVCEARNSGWDASCTYKRRDPKTGEWTIGLISNNPPLETETPEPFAFSKLPACHMIRASGQPRDEGDNIKSLLAEWAAEKGLTHSAVTCSLSAQSFQCWEWAIDDFMDQHTPRWIQRVAEAVFEIRDILIYPILFTVMALIMCGTGSPLFIGIGIFTIILMSGACKFVFLHQREDITQESHLQNY